MLTETGVPGRGIQHIDLAVADVQRSLGFYRMLLEPLGLTEYDRAATYRGTEEVVYLHFGRSFLGVRPADGGTYRHYDVGLEHLAFQVDTREEVDEAYERCVAAGSTIRRRPRSTTWNMRTRTTTRSSPSIRTGFESRSCVIAWT